MTRFQRINLIFGITLLALLITAAATTRAQTFEQAVVANATIALDLCIRPDVRGQARAQLFQQAGFTFTVDRSTVNSDTTFTFTAPADTVTVQLYYGETPEYCEVTTNHMGVTAAGPVLDAVVPRHYPTFQRRIDIGLPNAQGQPAQCTRYEDPTNPIGLVIGALPNRDNEACVDNGTARFYSSYRV